jgi:hypothetical protein
MKKEKIPKKTLVFLKDYKWLFVIVVIQFILVNNFFPISEVFNVKPIVNDTYPYVYYKTLLMKITLSEKKLIIYDPFFFAGHSYGKTAGYRIYFADEKIPTLLYLIFPTISTAFIFKSYIFFVCLIFPFMTYMTARNFTLDKQKCLIAAFLAIMIWQFEKLVHNMYYIGGGVNFTVMCFLSVLAISYFYKYVRKPERRCLIISLFLLSFSLITHIFSVIILSIPLMILIFYFYKKKSSDVNLTLLIPVIVALSILFFLFSKLIEPYFELHEPIPLFQTEGLKTVLSDLRGSTVFTIVSILGFYGIYLWQKDRKEMLVKLFLITSIFYFVYSYFGFYLKIITYTSPHKFIIPSILLLLIPSASSVQSICLYVKKFDKKYFLILLFVLVVFSVFKKPDIYANIKSQNVNSLNEKISTDMPEDVEELISWIKTNTTNDARILIEDSGHFSGHQYGGHLLALFPLYTHRQFIGGPVSYLNITENHLIGSFVEGVLFNLKNVSKYSLDELKNYLSLFNIKWIVAWSNESKKTFNKYPEFIHKIQSIDKFDVYEADIKPSFFSEGSGIINADYNKITISNASKGEIIIKYTFYDNELKTDPPLEISKSEPPNCGGCIKILNKNVTEFKILHKQPLVKNWWN